MCECKFLPYTVLFQLWDYTSREWVNCRTPSGSGVFIKMVLTRHDVMKQRERRVAGLCLRTSFRQTAEFHLSAFNQGRISKLGLSGQEGCEIHHSAPFHIVVHLSFSRTARCIELPPKMKGNCVLCFSVAIAEMDYEKPHYLEFCAFWSLIPIRVTQSFKHVLDRLNLHLFLNKKK